MRPSPSCRGPFLVALGCITGGLAAGGEPSMRDLIRDDFAFATAQYSQLLDRVKGDPNLPRTYAQGRVVTVPPRDWTSGFFPGALWLLYDYTRDPRWRSAAEEYTARLEPIKDFTGSHDVGFILLCSFGNGLRLTGRPDYRAVLLQGARSLSTRFSPAVGAIRSWDSHEWQYPVIIDNMMNLELLMWAAREGGEPRFRQIALSHADKTLANHFRPDGSSYHLVDYDPTTGRVLKQQTVQGAADDSAWARGQAWGLYGFVMMFRESRQPAYLDQAAKIARFLMNHPHLPDDKIPYWDFDAPGIPDAPRDASAAAIMCSALVELSAYVEPELSRQCLAVAERQVRSLSSPRYRAAPGENGNFLLRHCVGKKPANEEVDQPLIHADYYFLEALLRHRAMLPPAMP
ncbi:MAG TPA: glycoside hydrolase family 88 protein [Opitutaceae bacterium]|nr:glycoside hydrolase family 88 protein [Opitutaceae bacterium]